MSGSLLIALKKALIERDPRFVWSVVVGGGGWVAFALDNVNDSNGSRPHFTASNDARSRVKAGI